LTKLQACLRALLASACIGDCDARPATPPRLHVESLVQRIADTARLHLFVGDGHGQPVRTLGRAAELVAASGHRLMFAMNAGIYEPDLAPTGLAIEAGRELAPLNTRQGTGNFYSMPNGVFYVTDSGAAIARTTAFAAAMPAGVRLATQSGPMLLEDGAMPAASVQSASGTSARRLKRNAVCADRGVATLVMVDSGVTLHELALYLRDEVGCRNALYLDGAISQALDARSGRVDEGVPLGPIIGVVD
jgi:uncharacterized protein YigE (DUF2233 family)